MKTKILLCIILPALCCKIAHAQDLSGSYTVSGYFFHPATPRPISLTKIITKVGANTYQVDLGDLGPSGYAFQFTVDNTNHLTNWVSVGNTYPAPQSGFMTADDPGNFFPDGSGEPGTPPWVQSAYNNTYDPSTHTFYMHYGYSPGASDQTQYSRQIYEKYVLIPSAKITSVTPLNGTSFTEVTIKGKNLSLVDPAAFSISFGGTIADTAWVVSDKKLIAKVGAGASGNVSITDINYSTSTFPGFVYTPVPPVTNSQWSYVGKAGFSQNRAYWVSAAAASNNMFYVAYVDSASGRTRVMKYNGSKWISIGGDVSDGKSIFTNIMLTSTNVPIVGYVDSANGGNITIKKLSGGSWITLGNAGFTPAGAINQNPFSMALDNSDVPYVASAPSINFSDSITVFKLQGSKWINVGAKNFAVSGQGYINLAIDKTTNAPYVIFDDINVPGSFGGYQATVMKYTGTKWIIIGTQGFTSGRDGIYYPDIRVDEAGNVLASMQDDNGFERQSVYKLKAGAWNPLGYPHFSRGRAYFNCFATDKNNFVYALFQDGSYNKQGTVMKFAKNTGTWDTVGARGFIPFTDYFERNSLIFDTANTPLVAFSDKTHGGKLSVMRYDGNSLFADKQQSTDNASAENNNSLNIFPNPAHSAITINFVANTAGAVVEVINGKGQTVLQKQISLQKGSNNISLDISNLPAGIYTVSLKINNTAASKQFIKE